MTLYLVATPIGNLNDISQRALETLGKVDLILAEDTRRTGLLLNQFKLKKKMLSFHEHNEVSRVEEVVNLLKEGRSIALVSDAGTPTISDPGFKLIRSAIAHGIKVEPIPGPSAILAALSASGLPTDRFLFLGYLPKGKGKAQRLLDNVKKVIETLPITLIFFESPHRLLKTISALKTIFPASQLVVAKELTKIHEEFLRGEVGEVLEKLEKSSVKGEYTLVLRQEVASSHT